MQSRVGTTAEQEAAAWPPLWFPGTQSRVWKLGQENKFSLGQVSFSGNSDWEEVSLLWGLHRPGGKGKAFVTKGACSNQQGQNFFSNTRNTMFYTVCTRLWIYNFWSAGLFPSRKARTYCKRVNGDFYTAIWIANANRGLEEVKF